MTLGPHDLDASFNAQASLESSNHKLLLHGRPSITIIRQCPVNMLLAFMTYMVKNAAIISWMSHFSQAFLGAYIPLTLMRFQWHVVQCSAHACECMCIPLTRQPVGWWSGDCYNRGQVSRLAQRVATLIAYTMHENIAPISNLRHLNTI